MEWTWERILTELGYDKAQRTDIITRILAFNRREDMRTGGLLKSGDLQELNRLLGRSNFKRYIACPPRNILILADRLYGLGIGLEYYLHTCTPHKVFSVAYDFDCVVSLARKQHIDILIVAGLQHDSRNEIAVDFLRRRYQTYSIMWAGLDSAVYMTCQLFHINLPFDRHRPLEELAEYLSELSQAIPSHVNNTASGTKKEIGNLFLHWLRKHRE